jgi:molecular chaperone DnaK
VKSIEEYANLLSDKDKTEIKGDLENLNEQLATNDPARIKDGIKQLEGSAYRIADAIYAAETKK